MIVKKWKGDTMQQTWLQHYTIDQIADIYEKSSNRLISGWRRRKLDNTDFSILSNNCWGGHVYRRFGLPYNSPTVGLYFYAAEYILFLKELEKNVYGKLSFIKYNDSKYCKDLEKKGQTRIPIGLLNDEIEVMFLHYQSEKEAYEKWRRRSDRMNMSNLIVKFSQMNLCGIEELQEYQRLQFKKKILFTAEKIEGINSIVVKRYSKEHQITDDTTYFQKHIDLYKLINL